MRLERIARGTTVSPLGIWVGVVLLLGLAGSALWLRLGLPLPGCTFRQWTGLPCATCGSTRLMRALLSGDLREAIAWNPLVFVVLASVSVWSLGATLSRAFDFRGWRLVANRRERILLGGLAIVAVLVGWVFLLFAGI